ncbi:hypothetical protein [Celeribacter litoreus]|uniref:hypothetical protein n=1 Tax=Celeribacter litoreus TaxID=2876714 RepID=UPI001CCB217A|nr:hypothetical protein [Celeribacter litoreus]MCA0041978.1 hypothetical protein [Celeribacter litoreus]
MVSKKDSILIGLLTIFIVTPAVMSLIAYLITGNPSLRPLGITFERLIEAGQINDKSAIIALVEIGTEAESASPQSEYKAALEITFSRLETDVQVQFRTIKGSRAVNITYIVGESRIGPFPANRAAEGVIAATEAARMVVAQRQAIILEETRREEYRRGFWYRILE